MDVQVFRPSLKQREKMPLFSENNVPTYLFRISSPKTVGSTTTTCVSSPATKCGTTSRQQDIFEWPPAEAADRVNEHLRWRGEHQEICNLMSWTSSLLFALQYAVYRHNHDSTPFSEINLLVLDTREFPAGTFVKDLEIMSVLVSDEENSEKYNLGNLLKFRKGGMGYYFGEYLSQGKLDVNKRSNMNNLEQLVGAGLFRLLPELDTRENSWAKRVVDLRGLWHGSGATHALDRDEVHHAIRIGKLFGDQFTIPLSLALLAMKKRENAGPVLFDAFAPSLPEKEIEMIVRAGIRFDTGPMPEVEQTHSLYNDFIEHLRKQDRYECADLVISFDSLAIGSELDSGIASPSKYVAAGKSAVL